MPERFRLQRRGRVSTSGVYRGMTGVDHDGLFEADAELRADGLRCGELILALRARVRRLQCGQRLHLIADDEGAREDVRAWCRLTGNPLLIADHPHYLIARKDD